jgi:hypothetical protein
MRDYRRRLYMSYFWSLYSVSYRNLPEARSFELEYRSDLREDQLIPWGIPCFNGAVLMPTQTGGQLRSVRDSFLPTDPLAKDTAARNNCRIEHQPFLHPRVMHAESSYRLTVGDVFRWLHGLYRENFTGITWQRGPDRSLNSRVRMFAISTRGSLYNMG